jgi:hypothetical protein
VTRPAVTAPAAAAAVTARADDTGAAVASPAAAQGAAVTLPAAVTQRRLLPRWCPVAAAQDAPAPATTVRDLVIVCRYLAVRAVAAHDDANSGRAGHGPGAGH